MGSAKASPRKLSLGLSVIMAEASPGEAGGPRLRAWRHAHVGAAHRVGGALEDLGLMAFYDTPKVRSTVPLFCLPWKNAGPFRSCFAFPEVVAHEEVYG